MARQRSSREKWSLRESVLTFIPGNEVYGTMRSRNARHGVMFILPFIIGFLVFMAKPLIESLIMSFQEVNLNQDNTFIGLDNYKYAFGGDPYFNQRLVEEIPRMLINNPEKAPCSRLPGRPLLHRRSQASTRKDHGSSGSGPGSGSFYKGSPRCRSHRSRRRCRR